MPAVLICSIDPVRRHFITVLAQQDRDRTMLDSRIYCPAEQLLDLLRTGGRRDIPVLRSPCQDRIAHAAAYCIRLVTVELQIINDHQHFSRQIYLHLKLFFLKLYHILRRSFFSRL